MSLAQSDGKERGTLRWRVLSVFSIHRYLGRSDVERGRKGGREEAAFFCTIVILAHETRYQLLHQRKLENGKYLITGGA